MRRYTNQTRCRAHHAHRHHRPRWPCWPPPWCSSIANQQKATANERSRTQSVLRCRGGARLRRPDGQGREPHADGLGRTWLTQADLAAAFASEFPAAPTVDVRGTTTTSRQSTTPPSGTGRPNRRHKPITGCGSKPPSPTPDKTTKTRVRVLIQQIHAVRRGAAQGGDLQRHRHQAERHQRHLRGRRRRQRRHDREPMPRPTSLPEAPGSRRCPPADAEVGRFTMNSTADLRAPGATEPVAGHQGERSVAVGGTVTTTPAPPNDRILNLGRPQVHQRHHPARHRRVPQRLLRPGGPGRPRRRGPGGRARPRRRRPRLGIHRLHHDRAPTCPHALRTRRPRRCTARTD